MPLIIQKKISSVWPLLISKITLFHTYNNAGPGIHGKLLHRSRNSKTKEKNDKFLHTIPRHWFAECCCELITLFMCNLFTLGVSSDIFATLFFVLMFFGGPDIFPSGYIKEEAPRDVSREPALERGRTGAWKLLSAN